MYLVGETVDEYISIQVKTIIDVVKAFKVLIEYEALLNVRVMEDDDWPDMEDATSYGHSHIDRGLEVLHCGKRGISLVVPVPPPEWPAPINTGR